MYGDNTWHGCGCGARYNNKLSQYKPSSDHFVCKSSTYVVNAFFYVLHRYICKWLSERNQSNQNGIHVEVMASENKRWQNITVVAFAPTEWIALKPKTNKNEAIA